MIIKLPHNFVVYETSYGNDIPCEQLFLTHFDAVPSKFANKTMYDPKIIDYLKENVPDKVEIANNIDSAIRTWQQSKASELGFKNIQELLNL
jgi:hypothetical protein